MKRFQKIHLWLVLALIAITVAPSQAQLVFQFEQDGLGNTVVTGSGTGVTTASGLIDEFVGFNDFAGVLGVLAFRGATPAGWVANPLDVSIARMDPGSTLNVAGFVFTELLYSSGPGFDEQLLLHEFTAGSIPALTLVAAAGTATFPDPYTALFTNYAPGTVLQVSPGVLHFIIIGFVPATATPAGGGSRRIQSVLVADLLAMHSAEHSGMYWGHVINWVNQAAVDAALRGIFDDGFGPRNPMALTSTMNDSSNTSSLLRYMAFVQDENMNYKVALGLADPVERTIEVNMADTLSAQTGINFNGQSLNGGLPYAMMGVPMMPMAGGAATVHIVEASSGKAVIDDSKAVIEGDPLTRWELFVAGDFGSYDQDQLTDLLEGFDTKTYAGTVGLRYRINDWLKAGVAWSYVESDTNASGNLGDMDLDGNMATVFASGYRDQNWFELLYSYGSFDNEVKRNTGLGSTARGDTDSDSHNVRLQVGHNIQGGNNIVHGPVAGVRYGAGDVDPYSETGGGSAALDYNGSDFESTVGRLGWQVSHVRPTGWGRIVTQVRAAWEHEFIPENGTVSGSLQTSPFALVTGGSVSRFGGFSTSSDGGAHPGTDWMAAGAGISFQLDNGFAIRTDYEGAFFRNNASQHYASLKVSYEW